VALSTFAMFSVGHIISKTYQSPCCNLPFLITETQCSPVFLFAASYVTLEKVVSTWMGVRIRGVFMVHLGQESLFNSRYLEDLFIFKVISQILNIIFVYKLLKTYHNYKLLVSITRI